MATSSTGQYAAASTQNIAGSRFCVVSRRNVPIPSR